MLCVVVSKALSGCLVVEKPGDEKQAISQRNAKNVRGRSDWQLLCTLSNFTARLSARSFRERLNTLSVDKSTLPREKRTQVHVLLKKIEIALGVLALKCPHVEISF